jgi:hypothetical protein
MSGSNNHPITCPSCKAAFAVRGRALTLYATCPSCKKYFSLAPWNSEQIQFRTKYEPALKLGSKGRIDGVVYEVMGFVVKQETKYHYKWREYLLFNPFQGYAFLSEYDGNWNIIWPIEGDPSNGTVSWTFYHEDREYRIYQKYRGEVIYAQGEFFFDIVNLSDSTDNVEYIAPPYLLAVEKSADSLLWCQGEYIEPIEVATAFGVAISSLPLKEGRGYTQPLSTRFSDSALIKTAAALVVLLFILQIIFSNVSGNELVIDQSFDHTVMGDSAVFRTNSFTIPSQQSIEVELYAPVDNNWFYAEFGLINEETGEEFNFSHEVEFYHGYDDGNWSEGSTQATAFLSAIPAGKYHITIYPDFSTGLHTFTIKVNRNVIVWSNFVITVLIVLLFPVAYFIRKHMIEVKRWEDSDYSPYPQSE